MKKKSLTRIEPSVKSEIKNNEEEYLSAKTDYYRFVIRSEDKTMFSKLVKIPDSWDNYKPKEGILLTESIKARLSDIKKKMSWELKLQSMYFIYITSIENVIISVFQQRDIEKSELIDAVDSINNLILELDSELMNIKHLLLTLAKRSISDFYYLISSYCKFFYKKNFNYESDIKIVLLEFVRILNQQLLISDKIDLFLETERDIASLFQDSSNELGWRINEFAVKDFFENENQTLKIQKFNQILKEMYEYKNILRNYYVFLKYYYNESDGRLFRLRFVNDTLKQKKEENKITSETYKAFQKILESFIRYKICFESVGIAGFGDEKISYIDLVNIIYKLCKILEFYYLRNMKYESLQDLRTDYLLYIEKEIYTFIE